jgi:TPP-dependent indolepyruvate ferredoxin oxidoreductase alpha subunit
MIISELLQELTGRAQNAQVLVIENGAPIMIESVAKQEEESQKVVFLMGEAVKSPMAPRASRFLTEAMAQGVSKRFSAKIVESVHNPGKLQVSIDGTPFSTEFDTKDEARAYMQGFTMGFSVGGGIKGMADGLPSRLT